MTPDPRLKLSLVDGPIHALVADLDLSAFYIVFVDDSATIPARVKTIEAVAKAFPEAGLMVIHDYERAANRRAAGAIRKRFRLTALNPNTRIGWNKASITKSHLKVINRFVERHANVIPPDAVDH